MVQIRRVKRRSVWSLFRRGIIGLLKFITVSAFVPLLFVGRLWWYRSNAGLLRGSKSKSVTSAPLWTSVLDDVLAGKPFLSDIVELDHCNVQDLTKHRHNFTSWAVPLVEETSDAIIKANTLSATAITRMKQEFLLELLEMNLTCDFSRYAPGLPSDMEAPEPPASSDQLRLIYSIIAFQDVEMLEAIINAIHQPQHVILVHLDRHANTTFVEQVQTLAKKFDNVQILKFGTIVYATDSVSMIQYRIMRHVSQWEFDYFVTLDGASFPLWSDITVPLEENQAEVYLGETLRNGQVVQDSQVAHLTHRRLIFTSMKDDEQPLHKRLPRSTFDDTTIPDYIQQVLTTKTNSGNQGVYARSIVRQLVESTKVKELFALSKYGCCCCLEELNWAAALKLIGQEGFLSQASIIQVWGGEETCGSSMKNAVLTTDDKTCFRLEDATLSEKPAFIQDGYFWGNSTLAVLKHAKGRGILFARKFNSDSSLMQEIRDRVWKDEANEATTDDTPPAKQDDTSNDVDIDLEEVTENESRSED